jgi:hypothetical protein
MIITLTTDFGTKGPFAGVMKGVILTINPKATIVDLTHDITPHDIREAAFVIGDSFRYFPRRTVHVAVVDPGVGSGRRAIIVKSQGMYFAGPDNGVFTKVFSQAEKVVSITNKKYLLPVKGPTFHGRDVFAPAAAWLSKGIKPENFGPRIEDPVMLRLPEPVLKKGVIEGEVIYMDRFGNAITNITGEMVAALKTKNPAIKIKRLYLNLADFYAAARDKRPRAVVNSSGLIEIFVFDGDAGKALGIRVGDKVRAG